MQFKNLIGKTATSEIGLCFNLTSSTLWEVQSDVRRKMYTVRPFIETGTELLGISIHMAGANDSNMFQRKT